MRAMVLAAGLGTRLRPLTNDRPKALVEIGGRALLEITLARLRQFGVREAIVNAHHFADRVEQFLRDRKNFGMRIEVSREDILLDTGGGLKKAAWFFLEDGADEPFLLHNVDVVSTIDLGRMMDFHRERGALATLAVQQRESSRQLLFDGEGLLCGRRIQDASEWARECEHPVALAFSGIHVISSALLKKIREDGVFSIIETYLRLVREGETIAAFRADEFQWRDLGTVEAVRRAEEEQWIVNSE